MSKTVLYVDMVDSEEATHIGGPIHHRIVCVALTEDQVVQLQPRGGWESRCPLSIQEEQEKE